MSALVFYEKPACVGNARQQALLRAQGVEFTVRDLLSEPWTVETLRAFFGATPVSEWFNQSAPAVKDGEVDPDSCTEADALALMMEEPILIRRPLLQLGELRQSGFCEGPVLGALGVLLDEQEDLQACPMDAASTSVPSCGEPA